jgi:hypothetical protein
MEISAFVESIKNLMQQKVFANAPMTDRQSADIIDEAVIAGINPVQVIETAPRGFV